MKRSRRTRTSSNTGKLFQLGLASMLIPVVVGFMIPAALTTTVTHQSLQMPSQRTLQTIPITVLSGSPNGGLDDEPIGSDGLVRTLNGGPSLIFEMARRFAMEGEDNDKTSSELPRWHPVQGIADANPNFRKKSPSMDPEGYAGTIWKHARKSDQPSMWRYAVRCFRRMDESTTRTRVPRANTHYEGALVACAKLGDWQQAIEIYEEVQQKEAAWIARHGTTERSTIHKPTTFMTDNMIVNIIRACVRFARANRELTLTERREPLDSAVQAVHDLPSRIPLVARHLNSIAAAYQALGLYEEAAELLQTNLSDRSTGPEPEDGTDDTFNVHDLSAKDKGSYTLLVQGAISTGNWTGAVEALQEMTSAGLYPANRHLNAWTEVSERKTRQRSTRSWKKKREEYWLDSVRSSSPPSRRA